MAIKTHSLQKISTRFTNVLGLNNPRLTIPVEYLVVAGGGGGGANDAAGGGAGGLRTATGLATAIGVPITVTVGAGGSGGVNNTTGTQGSNSVFSSITSTGGGFGGADDNTPTAPLRYGGAGGSGGGAGVGGSSLSQTLLEGNAITTFYEIGRQTATAGPGYLWKVHDAYRKSDGKVYLLKI